MSKETLDLSQLKEVLYIEVRYGTLPLMAFGFPFSFLLFWDLVNFFIKIGNK